MNINLKQKLLALMLISASWWGHAEVAVVVGANSPIGNASSDDVVKIFLGKKKDHNGTAVVPVDQAEGNGARDEFYDKIVSKSASQLKSYWSRLIFTGKGQAPQVVGGDTDVKGMVASNPNMIGYIDAGAVDSTVKVIFKQ